MPPVPGEVLRDHDRFRSIEPGFDDEKYRQVGVSGYCRVLSTAIAGLCKHGEHTKRLCANVAADV